MSSGTAVFAWAGYFLVNIAFIGIISWGTIKNWVLGLVFNIIYAIALFGTAYTLERRIAPQQTEASEKDQEEGEDGEEEEEIREERRTSYNILTAVLNIMYLLFVFALSTCGIVLAFRLFSCEDRYQNEATEWTWEPKDEVPQVILDNSYERKGLSYVSFPSSEVTWYQVKVNQTTNILATSSTGASFVEYDGVRLRNPNYFFSDQDGTICMTDKEIYCSSDGIVVSKAISDGSEEEYFSTVNQTQSFHILSFFDDLLWLQGNSYDENDRYYGGGIIPWRGYYYVSVNIKTMERTLQSQKGNVEENKENKKCPANFEKNRRIAIFILFLSCIPALVASCLIYIYKRPAISSMILAAYVSLSGIAVTIYVSVDPMVSDLEVLLKWWFASTGAIAVLVLSYLALSNKLLKSDFLWGGFTSGTVWFAGACWVLHVFSEWDSINRWIIVNIICFIPFIGIGLALGMQYYLVLGVIGLVFDAFNFSLRISRWTDDIIFQYLFLAIFGTLIIAAGVYLLKISTRIKQHVDKWAETYIRSGIEKVENQDEENLQVKIN